MKHRLRNVLLILVPLLLLAAGAVWYGRRDKSDGPNLRTAPVARGDIVATISATGTVEPEEVIDVGAAVEQAKRTVRQQEAALKRAQHTRGYSTISSPVKGVISDRRVNIGQTVVASLSAPSLFLLAKALTKMQVWVAVNEADVGQI